MRAGVLDRGTSKPPSINSLVLTATVSSRQEAIRATLRRLSRVQPVTRVAVGIFALLAIGSLLAPWLAPYNPFDPAALDLMDAFLPPSWMADGESRYLLGTDDQGRDLLSAILYGSRLSLAVGFAAVLMAATIGCSLGLIAGYSGGWLDAMVMRTADVQLAIPGMLIALMIGGISRTALPSELQGEMSLLVLIVAIGIADWPQYARVVRSGTMVEKQKDYVAAARLLARSSPYILCRHVLPNILPPVMVLASVGLAVAITTEATLSFLGVGMPPTTPSLGTLIRIGQDFIFSGEWWIGFLPATVLVALVLSVNLIADSLRDRFDPKLS